MLGTLVNVVAIIIGSIVGLVVHSKINEKYKKIIFQAIGLFTLFLGVEMALKSNNYLIMILSLVIGSIIGKFFDLKEIINKIGDKLKKKLKSKNSKFSEGLVTSFLMFCMGSMTILGAFDEGLNGNSNLLFTKSVLDAVSSIILAASLVVGVLFSVIPLFLYQGGLTLFAVSLQNYLSEPIILQMTSVGGILLIGLGISILDIKKIRVLNRTPSLVVALIIAYFFV